jgi:hypothetical protein
MIILAMMACRLGNTVYERRGVYPRGERSVGEVERRQGAGQALVEQADQVGVFVGSGAS